MFAVHTRRNYRPYRQQWNKCRKIGGRYVVKHATEHWTLEGLASRPKHRCAHARARGKSSVFMFSITYVVHRFSLINNHLNKDDRLISPDVPASLETTDSEPRQHQDRADRVSNLKKLEQETESGPSQKSQKERDFHHKSGTSRC